MEENEGVGEALTKRIIATFISIGVLLLWVGLLLMTMDDRTLARVGGFLGFTGTLFAFLVALAGALGSKRTTDYQNLGLLIVAAALILTAGQFIR
jgi:hypothetical protein